MQISMINETSLIIYFSQDPSPPIIEKIISYKAFIQEKFKDIFTDIIASYTSLMVVINPLKINITDFYNQLMELQDSFSQQRFQQTLGKRVDIPVYYGKEVALDAQTVCSHTQLSFEEIIHIHQKQIYHIYAIGFAPGFAYLGKTDSKIHIPRLATPRAKVPALSVGLADWQTAIYPKTSPGGWQVIGRAALKIFDDNLENLTLFNVGDEVRFVSVSQKEFLSLGGQLL